MDRASARLEIKSIAGRRFSGVASTPTVDRDNQIVDLAGVSFTNPVPLLWRHDQAQPIGLAWLTKTDTAITFEAEIADVLEPGALKVRTDEARQSVAAKVVRGVSIGFRVLERAVERLANGVLKLGKVEICELSLVTIPANVDATILQIKAAAGRSLPGVSGVSITGGVMTTAESLVQWENKRAATAGLMASLMTKSNETGLALEGDEATKYDEYAAEIKGIDAQLERLRELERLAVKGATVVPFKPAGVPPSSIVSLKSAVEPGIRLARAASALLRSKGDRMLAIELAKQYRDTPEVELFLKAAVAPATTTDPNWAGPLVPTTNITGDFLEMLRPATVLGRVPGLRTVPFNAAVPMQTGGGTYNWVGEAKPKPVTAATFSSVRLGVSKAAGIIVLTDELARLSVPSAEALIRDEMIKGIAGFLDQQFLDPAVAAVAGVHPASITNGIAGIPATADPVNDIRALLTSFINAHVQLSSLVAIMSPANALALSMKKNAMGAPEFPGMNVNGGTLYGGINVITSSVVGTNIVAFDPSYILVADEGGVSIDVSREASVQMDSAPASPADATTVLVSFWQNNLIGLRAERYINWNRALTAAVNYISGTAYPAAA
jgi:HK97 family phage major capsid protein/HK97 family phage prohead protease